MNTKKPEAPGRGRLKLVLLGAFFLLVAGIALAWGVRHEEEVVRHLEHHQPAGAYTPPR